jgi:large subunit ribosomal protein L30
MASNKAQSGSNQSGSNQAGAKLKVTQLKSVHGQLRNIAASVKGLGLRRRHQSVVVSDTPEIRGMIYVANHMLKVERS